MRHRPDPAERAALDRFLAENPAMTVRDWKGKGFHAFAPFDKHYTAPCERPWDRLDRVEVRRAATSTKARFLSRSQRMAAARDPGLIFDERSRSYRLKADATPAPSTASDGEGAVESLEGHAFQTGGGPRKTINDETRKDF